MLINSEDIKKTKEYIKVMQAFIDGKNIEFKKLFSNDNYKKSTTTTWDFKTYSYRVEQSEPEFEYPIYRESKDYGIIVKFTGLSDGVYMTKTTSFNIGDTNKNFVEHTNNRFWKDYDPTIDISSDPEFVETIELFEVMVWCDILKEFSLKNILYSDEELENYNVTKTGRSFVIDKETKKLIKVNNN